MSPTVGRADHQQDIVRQQVGRRRRLVGDVDGVARGVEHRLQRVGHHLGVARFGADQDQDRGHRRRDRPGACRDATPTDGAGGDEGRCRASLPRHRENPVIAALEAGVLTLTLNRPQRLNAMSDALIKAMNHELARARDDADIRAVLLTGIGRGFAPAPTSPAARRSMPTANVPPDLGAGMDRLFNPMIRAMRELPKPIVGAINGVAAGGGANFALACDIVLAARSARFDQAFVRISLMPDLGGTWFLPRTVGDARARGLAMLGKSVPAEEAERMGMIWQTVDDDALMAEATGSRAVSPVGPTLSYAAIKQAINAAATDTLDEQLDLERDSQRALGRSADLKEGVVGFPRQTAGTVRGR